MSITIKDIARLSGVGISTVSRVMNNTGPVSEKTRKKVMSTIQELNYIPNNSARSLKASTSKNIALLVKGVSNPFFSKMIKVIEQKVELRGYPLIIQNIADDDSELDIAIQEKLDRNLCGVIIMGGNYGYSDEKFKQLGIPCVLLTISGGEEVDKSLFSSVIIDDEIEAFRATEYLISLGHKKIGFINNVSSDKLTPNVLRFDGYKRALKENDIDYDYNLVATDYTTDSSGFEIGFRMFKQLYNKNKDMTAVFCFADVVAIGAAKAAFTMGLRVPEDISIVGFDGIEMAEFFHPSIDTVSQPAYEMALSSVETLFEMMHGGKSKHMVYDAVLIKRGSCSNVNK